MEHLEEYLYVLCFAVLQGYFFVLTIKKLFKYKNFFPNNASWNTKVNRDAYEIQLENVSPEANQLIKEINEYLKSNEGTSDFNIIKDKTERNIDAIYEDATSKISYPTYLGLMGTFFGVYIGLTRFNEGIVVQQAITNIMVSELIAGVIISMLTSLIGLALMVLGNWIANEFQKKVESDKNKFYDFLQVQLMPQMGTSMVEALYNLQKTIKQLDPTFKTIISEFQNAFAECTNLLKGTFGENVQQLTVAVDVMGQNMSIINDNVKKQDELLRTIKQKETLATLEKFTQAAGKFDTVTTSIGKLNEIKENIAQSSQTLIEAQSNFIEQMTIPERVFEKVNTILNRITTFEDSINNLGENISKTQILGNSQMNLIEEQITAIQKKTNLATGYQEIADEELQKLYNSQIATINKLNARYKAAIEDHGEKFEASMIAFRSNFEKIVEECRVAVEEKRSEYIAEIQKSIDLDADNKILNHLAKLEELLKDLSEIKASIKNQPQIPQKLDELKTQIDKIKVTTTHPTPHDYTTSRSKPKRGFLGRILGR